MAEALLRRRLEDRKVPATVASAGFLESDWPAEDNVIAAMSEDGFDLQEHRSRTVSRQLVADADLVLTMTRQQLVDLSQLSPGDSSRIFQIRDLVRRAEAVGRRPPGLPFDAWLQRAGSGRTRSSLISGPLTDDIADPIGRDRRFYDETKAVLDDLVTRLADRIG